MLQAANTDLFNPIVPKDHNSKCQNLPFLLQTKPVSQLKLVFNFYFCTLGTNGLIILFYIIPFLSIIL